MNICHWIKNKGEEYMCDKKVKKGERMLFVGRFDGIYFTHSKPKQGILLHTQLNKIEKYKLRNIKCLGNKLSFKEVHFNYGKQIQLLKPVKGQHIVFFARIIQKKGKYILQNPTKMKRVTLQELDDLISIEKNKGESVCVIKK